MVNIGEVCYSLLLRERSRKQTKQKENLPEEPEKLFNKEDLINEIEKRLQKSDKKCNGKQILDVVLKIYVDLKAQEKVLSADAECCAKERFMDDLEDSL